MDSPPEATRPHLRVYASAPGAPRHRRPSDVTLLVVSLLVVSLLVAVHGTTIASADSAIATAIESLNSLIGLVWSASYLCLLLWAVTVGLYPLLRRGRRHLVLHYALAAVIACLLSLVVGAIEGASPAFVWTSLTTTDDTLPSLAVRVAVATAVVVTASPDLTAPLRWVGRVILIIGAIASVALGLAAPTGAVAGLAVGIAAAAVIRLWVGSTAGLLTAEYIVAGLAELSFPITQVGDSPLGTRGSQAVSALDADGRPCVVKVYGRDAQQAQLAGSVWSAVRRRGESFSLSRGRDEAVDHEAFVTLLAERAGVPVLGVRTAGVSAAGDGLIVLEGPKRSFADLRDADADIIAGVAAQAAAALARLHAAGITHGNITADSLAQHPDNRWVLTDFTEAEIGIDEDDAGIDIARLLTVLSVASNPEVAARSVVAAFGAARVSSALPYLQAVVLDHEQIAALKGSSFTIAEVASAAASAAGSTVPERIELRRITPGRVIGTLIAIIVAGALIGAIAQVNWQQVVSELAGADYRILAAGLVLSLFVQAFLAVAEMGSVTARLKYFPVLMLEYAIGFIAVVIPSTAARLALLARFLQKFGLAPSRSVTASAISSVMGLLVQVVLLIVIVLLPVPGFTTSPTTSDSSDSSSTTSDSFTIAGLLIMIVALTIGVLIVAMLIPKLRARILGRVRQTVALLRGQVQEARSAFDVLRQPAKVLRMLGGNLGAQLVQAAVLGVCVAAFGQSATWSQLILINTAAALLNGLAPVPGGIGVVEACLTLGLTAIGIPSTTALPIAIAYRAITFYLPPIWGAPAMGWLRRRQYI